MLLSIIIPNRNMGNYLRELLDVINEVPRRDSIEVILVDSRSNDDSIDIFRRNSRNQDTLIQDRDKSQVNAINLGLEVAKGLYFAYQNSDDLYNPNVLNDLIGLLSQDGPDIYSYSTLMFNNSGSTWKGVYHTTEKIPLDMFRNNIYVMNQGAVFKRSLVLRYGYLDENYDFAFDYEYVCRLVFSGVSVKYVRDILGLQRIHDGTKTTNMQELCVLETTNIRKHYFSSKSPLTELNLFLFRSRRFLKRFL